MIGRCTTGSCGTKHNRNCHAAGHARLVAFQRRGYCAGWHLQCLLDGWAEMSTEVSDQARDPKLEFFKSMKGWRLSLYFPYLTLSTTADTGNAEPQTPGSLTCRMPMSSQLPIRFIDCEGEGEVQLLSFVFFFHVVNIRNHLMD